MLNMPLAWPNVVRASVEEAFASKRMSLVRSALRMIGTLPEEQRGKPFRLGIVRTFTLETQIEALELALSTIPSQPKVFLGPLDNIEQVLLDSESELMAQRPDAVLALWRLEELHPGLAFESSRMSAASRIEAAEALIRRIQTLCKNFAAISHAPLFISTLPMPRRTGKLAGNHEPQGLNVVLLRINQALLALGADSSRINIFDFSGWANDFGSSAFDGKMDFFARQPLSAQALPSFCQDLSTTIRPLLRAPRKVLALDLDNVLWGGVLGEDGLSGLRIGQDFPGNIYWHIQQLALDIRSRGVLLVLTSKNNLSDVEAAFRSLPGMPIKLHDFAAIRANWQEKHKNLSDIAAELNLGLESFVFVDDQPFEREQMSFNLPQVKVLDVNEDPLSIVNALLSIRDFDAYRSSSEDLRRSEEYALQQKRRELEVDVPDKDEFLRTLCLEATVDKIREKSIARAVQMLGKTNQFNVTTRRHTESDLRQIIGESGSILLTVSLKDRFGDQGIVGLVVARKGTAVDEIEIDSFLLSCRAIGRGVENVLWTSLLKHSSAAGYRKVSAEYIATAKNSQVADLFGRFGMESSPDDLTEKHYHLSLPAICNPPSWVTVHDISKNE